MKKIILFIVLNLVFTSFSFSQSTCATAQNITVTASSTSINFDLTSETVNNEMGCDGSTPQDYADIWYDFTMPVNGNLFIDSHNWNNFTIYNVCSGTEIHCEPGDVLVENLVSGNNYKLRVYRTATQAINSLFQSFTIQAFESATNDTCNLSENITVTTASATTINFEISGADINNEIGCAGDTAQDYADIWYEFTMPEDGAITIDGAINWNNFALYDSCTGIELGCFTSNGTVENLINGNIYKLRVYRTAGTVTNPGWQSFTIQSSSTLSTEVFAENDFSIFPNPATNTVTIRTPEYINITKVEVFDVSGKKMQLLELINNTINVSKLQSGFYFMAITTGQNTVIKKMIVR
ncbi:MAG: T9SS type A sorting domain-containing protein [Flavobacteriaceae bacterium]|nr:T9SS type A sorting domain-containing protein [Flavobacteriaceae bacterium]